MLKFKLLIAVAAISTLLALSFAMADDQEEAELQKVFETGFAAINADDMAAFAAIHVQDETTVTIGPVEGDLNKGWTASKKSTQGFMASPLKMITPENVAIKVNGDAAWGVWTFMTEMSMGEETMTSANRLTLVFERVDGKWLVSHSHVSVGMPPPPVNSEK